MIGCSSEITCNSPYIKVGSSCCLDQNNNSICDKDESSNANTNKLETITPTTPSTSNEGLVIESNSIKFKKSSLSEYNQYIIIGEVKNYANETNDYPKITMTGYDKNNAIVCTNFVYANQVKFKQTSPFDMNVYATDCSNLYKYKLQTADNEVIGYVGNITSATTSDSADLSNTPKDKCSDVTDWTVQDTETQKDICYKGKYIDYAVSMQNISICDEIIDGNYLGQCYASVAYIDTNYTICKHIPIISYEAKGFMNNITSKDVCYFKYLMFLGEDITAYKKTTMPINICDNIDNEQFQAKCIQGRDVLIKANNILS